MATVVHVALLSCVHATVHGPDVMRVNGNSSESMYNRKQLSEVLVKSGKSRNRLTRVYTLMLSCPLRSVRFHTVLHWNGGCQLAERHPRGILRWVQCMFRLWVNVPSLDWGLLGWLAMLCRLNASMLSELVVVFRNARRTVGGQTKATRLDFIFFIFAPLEGIVCEMNHRMGPCFISCTF